ncbi:MAG: DUF1538 domain-containing protein [Spirochaetaceae bacterium]|nr:MAG: DUF1538 domain-containing protein [Spirochaetaceae bacterium]
MKPSGRIQLPLASKLGMIARYARVRIKEQIVAVAFVVIYLVGFQVLALGSTPRNAVEVAGGIALVVFGLTLFLEGLRLGLMPLGERVGIQLPGRGGLVAIVVFGLLVGVGSTLAEPAIAALRVAGGGVVAWEAPLLFVLLERIPGLLVLAVGAGVGVAVALGLVRFYFGFSLKPLIFAIIPLLIVLSVVFSRTPNLSSIIGLAWDTGAVTTGAVTVPLVLALGIGVSRAARRSEGATSGFGVVMLASAFPVLGVMVLALVVAPSIPEPTSEVEFFSADNRPAALALFADERALTRYAFMTGTEAGRRALFDDADDYHAVLDSLSTSADARQRVLAEVPLDQWLREGASQAERARLTVQIPASDEAATPQTATVIAEETVASVRAVVPLTLLLALVLVLLLRDRPRYLDEVVTGVMLALLGMALLTSGIRLGLAPLGDEIGRQLPQFVGHESGGDRTTIEGFDETIVFTPADPTGSARRFFPLYDGRDVRIVEFRPERHDPVLRRYVHIEGPRILLHPELPVIGIVILMLFAFGMGFGSTLAEPALNALGRTVEDLTVGTVKRGAVVRAVSIGVGVGLIFGVARIVYDVPIVWMLGPPYLILLVLTAFSEETFTGIAWDCGGVTTGTITVPLVLAMGLGIGGALSVVDGFGILALASVYPILSVLIYGLAVRMRRDRVLRETEVGGEHE